ncbi:hypothetical protein QAD02_013003 [Eretmocerus hayati]|uniref:Uncharacterized protein n=1 Tax=Eretmocerus hayati TaxID=131215 RepID=A0ACC2P311_9HYME|nr:hypothetical protein QAD02_013003 [Eretmocerus hayati]
MKVKNGRKRSVKTDFDNKVIFQNRMTESDKWKKVAQTYVGGTRQRTFKKRAKSLNWRSQKWGEEIFRRFNIKRNVIPQKSRRKPKVCRGQDLAVAGSRDYEIVHRNEDLGVDIWIPRSRFPNGFPDLDVTVAGHTLKKTSWESLGLNELGDDAITNSFLRLICCDAKARGKKILPFDIHLVQDILFDRPLGGFLQWVNNVDLIEYKIWLLPINANDHWTLLVIVPTRGLIIFLDSMHGNLNPMHLYRVCGFIRRYWWGGKKLNFAKWTLFTPRDTPTQYRGEGQPQEFDDLAMDSIRRRIAEILLNNAGFQDQYHSRGHNKKRLRSERRDKKSSSRRVGMIETSTLPLYDCQSTLQLCATLHEL